MAIPRVQPGSPFRPSAGAWNAFIAAAEAHAAQAAGKGGPPRAGGPIGHLRSGGVILVRNDSGADRARFEVLGIDSPVFPPDVMLASFQNDVVLSGLTPALADHAGRFVVLLEPLASGAIGLAAAAGVVPVKVNVAGADDAFADVADADASQLASGTTGAATILWKESGTGAGKWAVVRLGGGTAAPASNPLLDGDVHEDTAAGSPAAGDLVRASTVDAATRWRRFPAGAETYVLQIVSGLPEWVSLQTLLAALAAIATSMTLVTDVQIDGLNFQKAQYTAVKVLAGGSPTNPAWATYHTGTECEEPP